MVRKKIFAIAGSMRAKSTNQLILNYIQREWTDVFDVDMYESLDKLPFFNPDPDQENKYPQVENFRERIKNANGVIICTPEYVFSLPGILKNALEWTVSTTVLSDKPVAMIVASGLGEKTFESLSLILNTIGAKTTDASRILISGSRAKFNIAGEIIDEGTKSQIKASVNALIEMMHEEKASIH
jgi:chromate reductase, NAD(P)H dehydrogenase (quinone)